MKNKPQWFMLTVQLNPKPKPKPKPILDPRAHV